ncbi:glycosyl hydrolase catalytic core-domain-containing protein [Xylariaceae sp. FL0255]|nr:glycosyl hydrolase catalytic core-domain-containing protein [Xylariaceae sp. FL0255]
MGRAGYRVLVHPRNLLLLATPSMAEENKAKPTKTLKSEATSVKRGLIHIPNTQWPQDNSIWVESGSDLTWYYNYGQTPSPQFSNVPQSQFEYVPQKWGQSSDPTDTSFSTYVEQLIADGTAIKNVLAYNEPEYPYSYGGAQLDPPTAAQGWIADFIPLQSKGVRIGLPAVNGDDFGLSLMISCLFIGIMTSRGLRA